VLLGGHGRSPHRCERLAGCRRHPGDRTDGRQSTNRVGDGDRLVRFEVHDGIATITLDSPDNRNALSTLLVAQLREAMSAAITDPDVRAVVLTGAGPVFCAGADLREQQAR